MSSTDSGPDESLIEGQLDDPIRRENLWRDLLVLVYTNANYQQTRRRIFERRENIIKVISLVLASGAYIDFRSGFLASLTSGSGNLSALSQPTAVMSLVLLAIAVANSWGLVFKWNAKALDANKRFDSWIELETKINIVGLTNYTEEQRHTWLAEAARLGVGEPSPNAHLAYKAELEARRTLLHNARLLDTSVWARIVRFFVALPRPILALN